MHKATSRFWSCLEVLPEETRELARKNYALLESNPRHPSLHFKKVGNFWSVRVGLNHRALAIKDEDCFIWVWIGTHKKYQSMLKE